MPNEIDETYFASVETIKMKPGQRVAIAPREQPDEEWEPGEGEDETARPTVPVPILRAYDKQTFDPEIDVCDVALRDDGQVVVTAKNYGVAQVHVIDEHSEPMALIYDIVVDRNLRPKVSPSSAKQIKEN